MAENYPIFESSPQMKQASTRGPRGKYPWKTILPGQSFVVGKSSDTAQAFATLQTLQSLAYRNSKNSGKLFRVIQRGDHFEVGCIAAGSNTGSFSTAPGADVAQRVENINPAAPLGWPMPDKKG